MYVSSASTVNNVCSDNTCTVSLVDNTNGVDWAYNADHNSACAGSNFITEVTGHDEPENTHFWELEKKHRTDN